MRRLVLLIALLVPCGIFGQESNEGYTIVRQFLEYVNSGKLKSAESMTQLSFVVAFGKSYGSDDKDGISVALENLKMAEYKITKDLSVREQNGTKLVFVETVRAGAVIDIFEFALIRNRNSWKIFSWRAISEPPERRVDYPFLFRPPVSFPVSRPCTRCG